MSDIQNLPGTGANADHRVYSNFFSDNDIIQNVAIVQPKNLLIDVLRKYFRRDHVYTYRTDEYGYPLTVDLTGSEVDSEDTTKILISDVFRYEVKFFPSITVKTSGGSYNPLSFNQNQTVKYRSDRFVDALYGVKTTKVPTHRVYAGAWDMDFEVSVYSESHAELEEITEIVIMTLQYTAWNELRENGLFIKNLSISGESAEPYSNDYVFSHTISVSTRSEWRVKIPLEHVIARVVFYFDVVRHPIPGQATEADVLALNYDAILEISDITL